MGQVKTKLFEFGDHELNYLKEADKILGQAITRLGKVERVVIPDLFAALIHAMVGQQISVKAAHTIWDRLVGITTEFCPQAIAALTVSQIQSCGMTLKKAGYIKSIAEKTARGELVLSLLDRASDQEVIQKLSALAGIGPWTAEMLLLNSMERPNVVSWGDIAIRRGMCNLYGLDQITRKEFEEYKARYSPYGSVASIYLWQLSFV